MVDRFAGVDPLWVTFNEPTFYLVNELRRGGIGARDPEIVTNWLANARRQSMYKCEYLYF
ncbi:hypothetical protein [Nocardia asteroides]|uniref:hypothetical protein n=1 Tax=Nocardia asteroides TaxID=1824 RepID=UPI003664A0FA